MFVIKMKNYTVISLLVAVLFLCSVTLCLGQTLDESDFVIFESEVYHVSFYYPKSLLIPHATPPQENMTYTFRSSLGSDAWLTVRFISPNKPRH